MNDRTSERTATRDVALTVRVAVADDLEPLARLMADTGVAVDRTTARAHVARLIDAGQTFLLEFTGGGLAAAAHVTIDDGGGGGLDLLVVSRDADRDEIEPRMVAIAEAIRAAYAVKH